jgi:flagellar protein FlaJ
VESLEVMARENPSLHFRRILWQVINALKSGADVAVTLKEIVDSMLVDQRVAIKKYGSELNPLALFYMLLVVIFPTLGIIFMLVLFSFVGSLAIDLRVIMFGVLVFLFVFQFMFIGMVKSKRPVGV